MGDRCFQISNHSCSAEDDSEELKEPLLGHDADSTRTSEAHSQQHDSQSGCSRALVPHSINRLNWEELWRVLWGNCCEGFAGILGEPLCLVLSWSRKRSPHNHMHLSCSGCRLCSHFMPAPELMCPVHCSHSQQLSRSSAAIWPTQRATHPATGTGISACRMLSTSPSFDPMKVCLLSNDGIHVCCAVTMQMCLHL